MLASVKKAVNAFFQNLITPSCEHRRANLSARFCPDCGYKVKLVWVMIKCRSCQARRVPDKSVVLGAVRPLEKFCRHCGSTDYQIVKKDRIDAYELMYCVSLKEIDYTEEAPPNAEPVRQTAPFNIVEGEVLNSAFVSQRTASAWQEAPYHWTSQQDGLKLPKPWGSEG